MPKRQKKVPDFWKLPRAEQSVAAVCLMYEGCYVDRQVIIGKIQALRLLEISDEQFRTWFVKMMNAKKPMEGSANK